MNLAFRMAGGAADERPRLPGSLHLNRRISQWLRIRADGFVEVRPGKVELGQGIATALAQIAAEELDVDLERIRMIPATTGESPDEAVTSGSLSIQESGTALRHACAEARAILLETAAARLGLSRETLRVVNGEILARDHAVRTSYWALASDEILEREATGNVSPKAGHLHTVVGLSSPRLDLPDKVFGRARFVHDMVLPLMVHGRVLRPPSPAATLLALDETAARALPGVLEVVRDGRFVGVLAQREDVALKAVERLRARATWSEAQTLPDDGHLADWLVAQPSDTTTVLETPERTAAGGSTASDAGGPRVSAGLPPSAVPARTLSERYTRPFLSHASIGPSCAVAQWRDGRLRVWSHTQGPYNLRADLCLALDAPAERIVVEHVEGAGCYGHNGADDVALDAALLARAAGDRPVKVVWSREDEFTWAPLGPAMRVEIEADLDGSGEVLAWRHEVWSNGHSTRPGRARTPTLLAAAHCEDGAATPVAVNAPLAAGGGAERNAVPPYGFPALRVISHRVLSMPIRVSALRSLGAFANVFAVESFVDTIAAGRGEDPLAWRLRHLADPRARAVLEAAALRAGWAGRRRIDGEGHGIGFARYKGTGAYCAVVARVEAGRRIHVRRLTIAVDVGLVVNPDGVINQIEGGAIQAASWALEEAVRFDRTRLSSGSWESYPILRFSEVPEVEVEILSHPGEPSVGAGEAALGPTAGAIGNAVFDALGVRVNDLPITPERVVAAAG